MILNRIFFDEKQKRYITDSINNCIICNKECEGSLILIENYSKRKSSLDIYCKECIMKRKEYGLIVGRKVVGIVEEIPNNAKQVYLHVPALISSSSISIFKAADIKCEGVTIDNTRYANRSQKLQQLNYTKRKEEINKEIEYKDKEMSVKEAITYLRNITRSEGE